MTFETMPLIMIVEDDEMTQILTKTIIEMSGYTAISAYNGSQCLDYLKEGNIPDVILMDVMMPVMNGVECLKHIKSDPELDYLPVIFLTALNDLEIIKECFDWEATDFIMKPFKNIELLARLGAAVRLSRKNKALLNEKKNLEKINNEISRKIYAFETQNNELIKIDEAKDNFISEVTHDFKTPLTGIRSIAEMMMTNPADDKQTNDEYLNFIISQVDIINRMIFMTMRSLKKIPDLSHIKPVLTNIKNFMKSLANDFKIMALSNDTIFNYSYSTDIEEVEIDKDKMQELLTNIFSNSIKYAGKGNIDLNVFSESNILYVTIKDSGNGIIPGEEDKIFTKFYRSDENSPIDGDGLGLYIAKKIALAHNGNITAENCESGGAKFTLTLPVKRSSNA